jgi:hypothetical protein
MNSKQAPVNQVDRRGAVSSGLASGFEREAAGAGEQAFIRPLRGEDPGPQRDKGERTLVETRRLV